MAAIPATFGTGGSGLTPGQSAGDPNLATILRDIADDLTGVHTAIKAVTAKLDADDVTNLDTDYAALCDPDDLLTSKA
jgi:hypothetical protein